MEVMKNKMGIKDALVIYQEGKRKKRLEKRKLIQLKSEFYRKLNERIERISRMMATLVNQRYRKTQHRIPIPVNMDLYAEYLVMQKLLETGLEAIHNKENEWPSEVKRKADICIVSGEKKKLVEVKYSKYWETNGPEYRWQFQNIKPKNFDFLVLVADHPKKSYQFFIFTKEEAEKYIPLCDWAWRFPSHENYANRWIGIYEHPDDWKKHMEKWNPRRPNPMRAKQQYMLSKNDFVGYINTNIDRFKNQWGKIIEEMR